MDNPWTQAIRENRKGNEEWTIHGHRQLEKTEREIKNGQSMDTGNIGHQTRNEDKQIKHSTENLKDEQHRPHQPHNLLCFLKKLNVLYYSNWYLYSHSPIFSSMVATRLEGGRGKTGTVIANKI